MATNLVNRALKAYDNRGAQYAAGVLNSGIEAVRSNYQIEAQNSIKDLKDKLDSAKLSQISGRMKQDVQELYQTGTQLFDYLKNKINQDDIQKIIDANSKAGGFVFP